MRKLFLSLCFLICFDSMAVAAITRDEALHLFIKADIAVKDGKYAEAAPFYEQILSGGWASGSVYYNLGNSYFKQGALGKAILNYERARRLIPRDSDLRANLQYANSLVRGFPGETGGSFWMKFADYAMQSATHREILWGFVFLLILGALIHLSPLYFGLRQRSFRRWLRVVVGLMMLLAFSYTVMVTQQAGQCIVMKGTGATFEPREGATVYFDLYEGQKVWVINREGLWKKIRRSDGKMGWIPQGTIEEI